MVFVVGQDSPILEAICAAVAPVERSTGPDPAHREQTRFTLEPPALDRGALFARLLRYRPAAVVLVDGLKGLGGPAPAERVDVPEVVGAAAGAGVRKLVLVTTRAPDDAALVHLRRSGIPYVVLHAEAVVELSGAVDRGSLAERKILVPSEVVSAAKDAVCADDVVRAVQDVLGRADVTGRTIAIEPTSERSPVVVVLEREGARPILEAGWRSRVTRWFGRPLVQVADDGGLSIRAGRADPREASRPLPEVARAI